MGRRVVETGRLIVRPPEAADVEPLAALWCDPAATAYMGGPRNFDRVCESIREGRALSKEPRFDLWAVIEKATGDVVGHCGLLDKEIDGRPEIELIYVIAPRRWGRGYGTEAGEAIRNHGVITFACHRLAALIHPENLASKRVAEKLDFHFERAVERPHGLLHLYVFATGSLRNH